jgi:hypothetical protein
MDGSIFTTKTIYICFYQPLFSPPKDDDNMSTASNNDETNSGNELTYKENLDEVRRNLVDKIGDYFNSKQARNLFSPNTLPDESISNILEKRIELLEQMMVITEVLYKHTNRANKYIPDTKQKLGLDAK